MWYRGLMSEVDYFVLDEWYNWIIEHHRCHVDQIGSFVHILCHLSVITCKDVKKPLLLCVLLF